MLASLKAVETHLKWAIKHGRRVMGALAPFIKLVKQIGLDQETDNIWSNKQNLINRTSRKVRPDYFYFKLQKGCIFIQH